MRIRYRRLTSSFDTGTYLRDIQSVASESRWDARARGEDAGVAAAMVEAVDGLFSTPLQVDAHDGEGTVEEFLALLRAGELQPTDLVDSGKGWSTCAEHPELSALCDELEDASRRRARWRAVGIAVAVVLALALTYFLAVNDP